MRRKRRGDRPSRFSAVSLILIVGGSFFVPANHRIAALQVRYAHSPAREEFLKHLVAAAIERTSHSVRYVGAYVRIPYPGGDVPEDTGVCTDEIIRSYRAAGIDLQKKYTKTCSEILGRIPASGFGDWRIRIPMSIIGVCRI